MTKLEEICRKYGLCNCDEAYTSRNLTAPDCPYHAFPIEEAMEEYTKECCEISFRILYDNYKNGIINPFDKKQDIDLLKQLILNPKNIILL